MPEIKPNTCTIAEAVSTIRKLPPTIPAMIWGPPGSGKTKALIAGFALDGIPMIPVLAGQSEPTDLLGIPFNHEDKYAKYVVPYWAYWASEAAVDDPEVPDMYKGPMALFFDDIVTAHEQTQAAFYKLVDEKHAGEHKIRENVRMIGAGNRVDDASAVTDMPKALCNRFYHAYVEPDEEVWLDWATQKGHIHPHIVFYLRQKPGSLTTFDDFKDKSDIHAFATPRTWEMLSKALFALDQQGLRGNNYDGDVDHDFNVVQGCIGTLASEFTATVRNGYNVVPIEEILKNPKTAEVPDLDYVDRLHATVSNIEFWFSKEENLMKFEPLMEYAMRIHDEFGVLLARTLLSALRERMTPEQRQKMLTSKLFKEILVKWRTELNVTI